MERPPGGRAQVHVPVGHGGIWGRILRQPAAGHGPHPGGVRVDPLHRAEPARPGQFAGEREVRQVPPLCPRLEDRAAPPHRVAEDETLGDVLGAGLLAVDVLAGLRGEHRHQAVPVGPGGDQHGVDVGLVEELVKILIRVAVGGAMVLVDDPLDRSATVFLDVADGDELHVGLLEKTAEVVFTPAADADATDANPLTRRHRTVEARGGGTRGKSAPEKRPPTQLVIRSLHESLQRKRPGSSCNSFSSVFPIATACTVSASMFVPFADGSKLCSTFPHGR